jgi:hypothetical protein
MKAVRSRIGIPQGQRAALPPELEFGGFNAAVQTIMFCVAVFHGK